MERRTVIIGMLASASYMSLPLSVRAATADYPGFADAVSAAANSNWGNAESARGGLYLVAQFDSSGDDAWDVAAHPLVYMTSESHANPNPNKTIEGGWAGFHLIDAYDRTVIAQFIGVITPKADGLRGAPHGACTSPDGKWGYIGWSEVDGSTTGYTSYVAVINMRTLKLDKLLKQESRVRGAPRAQRLHHIQGWVDIDGNHRVVLMFGFGADGGPHFVLDPLDDNRVNRAITYEDVQVMGHPFTTPSPDGKTLYVSIGSPEIREADSHHAAGVAKVNLDDGSVTNVMGSGNHPIGITHTEDGAFTYVIDGHGSTVYKLDNALNEFVGSCSAGVAGPYGIAMNWDESRIFTVGKGEGSHNRGSVLGVIDTKTFTPARDLQQQPIFLGGSASSVDHAILHPDPEVNQLWVSNMNGWDTIVLDLETYQPIDHILTPNGGDTHSGCFVRYGADWSGELLADQGGPKAESMRELVRAAKAAAAG